ncbi:hypothetical protein ZWY2020_030016 [Hordeum vulgare]|nr:hypothetical protein ZWY2020_030009 [Hordeum vulgare]KAI4988386.1 hypothetical protein ZWY2020_030016 [Hordeum vulgare]
MQSCCSVCQIRIHEEKDEHRDLMVEELEGMDIVTNARRGRRERRRVSRASSLPCPCPTPLSCLSGRTKRLATGVGLRVGAQRRVRGLATGGAERWEATSAGGTCGTTTPAVFFTDHEAIELPEAVDRMYHETEKTITIGGEHGTVAWVDLWRGIFFRDVLKKRPRLHDVPLPAPARSNWDRLLRNGYPGYLRDVAISRNKDSIKYVELEFRSRQVLNAAAATTAPVSYADWVRNDSTMNSQSEVIHGGWKSTTWNMATPVGGLWKGWHPDCVFDVKDVSLEPCLSDRMAMLSSMPMQELQMAYPILSMDDDVVYLLSHNLGVMFAFDVRKSTLRGLAEIDVHKFVFESSFCTSEICRGT